MTELESRKQSSSHLKYSKRHLHYSNLDPQYFVKTRPKVIHNLAISQLALENISSQIQRKLIQSIKNIKCSHNLKLRFGHCNLKTLKKVIAPLRILKGLDTLNINFFGFPRDGLSRLRALPMRLASNGRRLENLSLDFTSSEMEFDPTLYLTCLFMKRQIALKSLNVVFQRTISGDLSPFSKRLQKNGLPLTDLSLDFSRCSKMKKGSLYVLTTRGLRNLPNLENLCLKLGTPFDKVNSSFTFNMEKSKELKSFSFDFCGYSNAAVQDFKSLTGQLRSWATSLKTLHVKFPNVDSQIFAESLADLKALKSLKLEFKEGTPLTQDFMESLAKGLEPLETLHLEMNDCELESFILEALIKGIKEKKSLKDLKLSFGKNPGIDRKGISNFFDALKEVKELEDLDLSLEGCEIDNSNIDPLASSIEKLTKLKELKLCLHLKETEYTQWDKRAMIELDMDRLSASLSQLPNLSTLKLNLLNINFDSANLIENIKKIETLRSLEIFFNGKEDVSDMGRPNIMKNFSGLRSIPNLRDLSINIMRPSHGDAWSLLHDLESMNKLTALRVGFYQKQAEFNEVGEVFSNLTKSLRGELKSFEIIFHHCNFIKSGLTKDLFKGLEQLKQTENVRFQLIQTGIRYFDYETKKKLLGNMVNNMKNLRKLYFGVNDII